MAINKFIQAFMQQIGRPMCGQARNKTIILKESLRLSSYFSSGIVDNTRCKMCGYMCL